MGNRDSEHYKEMAEHCEREAEALPDIEIKRQFQELARQWRELAKHSERGAHDARNPGRPSQ
jgi:hypothetical protein